MTEPAALPLRRTPRSLIVGALVGAGWLVTFLFALVVVVRLIRLSDHVGRLFALETLTLWLFLPVYAVLVMAALLRQRALLVVAVVLVLAHLLWVLPDARWWPASQPRAVAEPFTLVAANVLFDNARGAAAAGALLDTDADVLVVLELSPHMRDVLQAEHVLDRLPHRIENPADGAFGSAIYSRYPLGEGEVFALAGFPAVRAEINLPGGPATLVAVHTLQPLIGLEVLQEQLGQLEELARATPGPLILAGDFNVSRQHRPFRELLRGDLRDAHQERGRGLARTWPAGARRIPFALLDHVVVSDELAVLDIDEAGIPGSDHRAVVTRLALASPG